MQKPLCNKI